MAFGRIKANNQLFFMNTGNIFGIQSYSIDQNFGESTLKHLGFDDQSLNQVLNAPQYVDLSFNSFLVNDDIFIQNTGLAPINCFILNDKNNINTAYSFTSGYLNNYSVRYSPNQIPQINSSFRFYNNCGNINTGVLDSYALNQLNTISNNVYPPFNNNIANCNYLNLTLNESTGNRILDYSFSLNINRLPIYNIGSRTPIKNEIIFPISVECDFTFEADENFIDSNLFDFPQNLTKQNIEIDIYSNLSNNLMGQYKFQNMTMASNKRGLSVDGNVTISRKYIGQIFGFTDNISGIGIGYLDFGFTYSSPSFFLDFGYTNTSPTSFIDFGGI